MSASIAIWNAFACRLMARSFHESVVPGVGEMNGSVLGNSSGAVGSAAPSTIPVPWRLRRSQSTPSRLKSLVDTSTMRASSMTCCKGTSIAFTTICTSAITRGLVTMISRLPPRSIWTSGARLLMASRTSSALANLRSTR